jgi:hypothetical protein
MVQDFERLKQLSSQTPRFYQDSEWDKSEN